MRAGVQEVVAGEKKNLRDGCNPCWISLKRIEDHGPLWGSRRNPLRRQLERGVRSARGVTSGPQSLPRFESFNDHSRRLPLEVRTESRSNVMTCRPCRNT